MSSLIFCIIFGFVSTAPRKGKKSSGKQQAAVLTGDELIDWNIRKIKKSEPCFFDPDIWSSIPNEFLPDFPKQLKDFRLLLERCMSKYRMVFKMRVDQLGLIGESIQTWLNIINQLIHEDQTAIEDMIGSRNIRKIEPLNERLLQPIKSMNDRLNSVYLPGPPGRILDLNVDWTPREDALWKAYQLGTGICNHIKEEPLKIIAAQARNAFQKIGVLRSRAYSGLADDISKYIIFTSPSTHELYYEGYIFRHICRNLNSNGTNIRVHFMHSSHKHKREPFCRVQVYRILNQFLPGGPVDLFQPFPSRTRGDESQSEQDKDFGDDFESALEQDRFLTFDSMILETLSKQYGIKLTQKGSTSDDNIYRCRYWALSRVREAIDCLVLVENLPDFESIRAKLSAVATNLLGECFSRFENYMRFTVQNVTKSPSYMGAMEFIEKVQKIINDEKYYQYSLIKLLRVRGQDVSPLEREMFKMELNNIDTKEIYKTGGPICEIFKSFLWKESIKLSPAVNEVFELLADMYRAPYFRPRVRHHMIDIYNLWNICSQIMLIPFEASSSSG